MTEKIEKLFKLARAVNGYDGSLDILDFFDIEEMREILFRGKRTNGEWVYGDLTRYSDTMSYITVDLIKNEVYEVATETVGQYTGIKDKNGKKIYEGDILEDSKGIAVVYYTPPAFTAEDKDCEVFALGKGLVEITKLVDTKIIGNITDNKELLGVGVVE